MPNPRGSTGYGHQFTVANVNDWGGRDFQDIMAGVDAVIAKGSQDIHFDMGEVVSWSLVPAYGYPKHPPFPAWVAAVWFAAFPYADWAFYLLSMTSIGVALSTGQDDTAERLLRVAAIVKELESGKFPRSEWVEKAPSLMIGFFVSDTPPPASRTAFSGVRPPPRIRSRAPSMKTAGGARSGIRSPTRRARSSITATRTAPTITTIGTRETFA